jgi:hypothetical protein
MARKSEQGLMFDPSFHHCVSIPIKNMHQKVRIVASPESWRTLLKKVSHKTNINTEYLLKRRVGFLLHM